MRPLTVVVTEPEYRKAASVFEAAAPQIRCVPAPPREPELAAAIRELRADHAIVGALRYEDELYGALPRGAVLARFGVGHDGIDKARATAARLLATNTPGVLDQSVAEHTLSLMLAAARHTVDEAAAMRTGKWSSAPGHELGGKVLAVIGCGPIGCRVARIAGLGFRMRVIGCRSGRKAGTPLPDAAGFESVVLDFHAAVAEAAFVSLHIPATPANLHFVNAERIAMMRPSCRLINTARGAVVDENALYDALAAGRLAGAALDVFEREPYEPADPRRDLRSLANVILTPHTGSNTVEANRRMAERALKNIALAGAGDFASMDLLNPEVLGPAPARP
jgi:phosphoglycerate dehydrogenase-like enzyme